MPALDLSLLGKRGASLTYWLSPYLNHENHEIGEGDKLPEWLDGSGLRNAAAAQTDPDQQPTLRVDHGRGLWALEFFNNPEGLTFNSLEGPDYNDLVGPGPKTVEAAFKTGDDVNTLQQLVSCSNDRWSMYIEDGELHARDATGSGNDVVSIPGLVEQSFYVGIITKGGGKLWVGLNDPIGLKSTSSGGNTLALTNITIGAEGIANGFNGLFCELLVFNSFLKDFERAIVTNYLAANWLDRGDPLEQAREPGSRLFLDFGANRLRAAADLPLEFADRELFEAVHVAHPQGADPHEQGQGWPYDDSRPMRLAGITEDMDAQVIKARVADMRIANALWNGCDHRYSGDARREGQAVVARAARNFSRVTPGYAKPPGGVVIEVPAMTELLEDEGIVCEAFSTNQLLRSSAIDGFTGVTKSGETGGAAITLGTAVPLLIDPDTAASLGGDSQSWDFLAGDPTHLADLYIEQATISSVPANSVYGVSIDHLTLTPGMNGKLAQQLQRSVDSFCWNHATQAWQAGAVWNECENTASVEIIERAYFGGIDTGASVTDLTFRYGLPAGGDAARQCRVYHAQLEQGTAFPGSRILTNGTVKDRSETRLWFYNGTVLHDRPFPNDCGTFLCRFKPLWNTLEGQVESSDFHLLVARHTTDPVAAGLINCYRMFYTSDDEEFLFAANDGTTDWATAFPHTVTRLTEIRAAARWVSLSRAQVGYAPGTMSVFINGAKGPIDAVRTANPPLSVDSQIWAGNTPRGRQICGWLLEWRVLPFPMTDREIYRWAQ